MTNELEDGILTTLMRDFRFRFEKNNEISYWQDFSPKKGLPWDRLFEFQHLMYRNRASLVSRGYGKDPYGCGGITVYISDILPFRKHGPTLEEQERGEWK